MKNGKIQKDTGPVLLVETDGRELEHQGDGLFGSLLLQRPEQPDDIFRLLYGISGLPERDHRDLPFGIKLVVSSDGRFQNGTYLPFGCPADQGDEPLLHTAPPAI